jgi:hypothetical protein
MSALEGRQDDGDARAGLYLDSNININSSSSNINSSSSSSRPLDGMVVVLAGAVLPGGTKVSSRFDAKDTCQQHNVLLLYQTT